MFRYMILFVLFMVGAATPVLAVDTLQVSTPDPVLEAWRWTEFDRSSGLAGAVRDIFDHVTPQMSIAQEEIFGPVLSTMRTADLDTAIQYCNSGFGNATVLFTQSGAAARKFRHSVNAGMVGINVGVPAPMAFFPFSGWNNSFFGDLHVQGHEGVSFFTRQKVTISRWIETRKHFF